VPGAVARAAAPTRCAALAGAVANGSGAAAAVLWLALGDPAGWRATAIIAAVAVGLALQAGLDIAMVNVSPRPNSRTDPVAASSG